MVDRLSPERRSLLMARVRGKDTKPEMAVRRALHAMGVRFRLHRRDLPGSPDIVLPRHRIAIFVHGCFWHRHPGCRLASAPKSRVDFWQAKFDRNIERDATNLAALGAAGWKVGVVWECETRNDTTLATAVHRSLAGLPPPAMVGRLSDEQGEDLHDG